MQFPRKSKEIWKAVLNKFMTSDESGTETVDETARHVITLAMEGDKRQEFSTWVRWQTKQEEIQAVQDPNST